MTRVFEGAAWKTAIFGLFALGSLGLAAAPAALAEPSVSSQPATHVAAHENDHWKAECWWIDDRKADDRRWGTARGAGGSRGGALQAARGDVPNGAFVHHCDSKH